jgi:hypothetical protein
MNYWHRSMSTSLRWKLHAPPQSGLHELYSRIYVNDTNHKEVISGMKTFMHASIRRAFKKFSEMWYSTEMVGHMTMLT